MIRQHRKIALWLLMCISMGLVGQGTTQAQLSPAATGAFIEQNGLVVIEMESVNNRPSNWLLLPNESNKATNSKNIDANTATGDQYLMWQGSSDIDNSRDAGRMVYEVQINNPGVYRFDWRNQIGEGSNTTEHNDTWLKIEADAFYGYRDSDNSTVCPIGYDSSQNDCSGKQPAGSGGDGYFKVYSSGAGDWKWSARTSDRDAHDIFARFDSPGTYRIRLAGRSKYHVIDRMIMVNESIYSGDPENLNLSESPRTDELTADTNFVVNSSFNGGTSGWGFYGDIDFAAPNGELRFGRQNPGWRGAVVFQTLAPDVPAGSPMVAAVTLGNASRLPQRVELLLRAPDYSDVISCAVTLPPNSSMQRVTVRDVTDTNWSSMVVSLRALDPDNIAGIRADNVSVQYRPNAGISNYSCNGYGAPTSTELVPNGNFSQGRAYWLLFGDYDFTLTNGVMNFWRTSGATRNAVLFNNDIAQHLKPASPLNLTLELGNSSNTAKQVQVLLRDVNWVQNIQCNYTIPANTGLTNIQLQGETTQPWSRPIVLVRALDADGQAAVRVDNVSLTYQPTLNVGQNCFGAFASSADSVDVTVPDGAKSPPTILPDGGITPDTDGAAPAPVAPPNPGGIPEIPGF